MLRFKGKIIQLAVSRKKGKSIYYLLPGQGRGARKRFVRNLIVAVIVGSMTAGVFALIFYLVYR
jgi:hypothetical protein